MGTLWVALLGLFAALEADAGTIVRYQFTVEAAMVQDDLASGIQDGDSIFLSIDVASEDLEPATPTLGNYDWVAIRFDLGGRIFEAEAADFKVVGVFDSDVDRIAFFMDRFSGSFDGVAADLNVLSGLGTILELLDSTSNVFSSDSLPTEMSLNDFDLVMFQPFSVSTAEGTFQAFGTVTEASAALVPEPASGALVAIGLICLARVRSRRRSR